MQSDPQTLKILQELQALLVELSDEVGGLNEFTASRRPGEGLWSVKEVVCHLRDAQDIFHARLQRMRSEDNPYIKGVDMDRVANEKHYIAEDWRDAWAGLLAAHEKNMAFFAGLSDAEWHRPARHQEIGPITIASIPAILRDHVRGHIGQVRTIKEQNALREKRQNESYSQRRYDYGNEDEDERYDRHR